MKKNYFTLFILIINSAVLLSQVLPIVENFNFTGSLTTNGGWLNYPTAGINTSYPATSTITPTTPMTFAGYPLGGGNAAQILDDGEDVYKPFNAQTSGTVYTSAIIQVNAAPTSHVYFYHFYGKNTAATLANYQYARLSALDKTTGIEFGLSKSNTSPPAANGGTVINPVTSTIYPYGATVLVVLKYVFDASGAANDPVSAYIFDSGNFPATEPSSPTLGPISAGVTGAGDAGQLLGVSLRRNNSSQNAIIDGIKVANTWAQILLPVTLTRFDVKNDNTNAYISWQVGIEKDEPIYTVQYSKDGLSFQDIHTQKSDNEHFNFDKKYNHTVTDLSSGSHYFRLKMTDRAGWLDYSPIRSIQIKKANFKVAFANNEIALSAIEGHHFSEDVAFDVINAEGRIIRSFKLKDNQQNFDTSDLPSGHYFLNCPQELGIQGFRFFKK